MMTTVTVSEFRDNLSKYLDLLVKKGATVKLVDGRKGEIKATLKNEAEEDFDWNEHMKFMKKLKPFWTKEDSKKLKEYRKRSRDRSKKLNW